MAALLLLLFLSFMFLGMPIAFAIGTATTIAMPVLTTIPLSILAQRLFAGMASFPLLAVPFFILAGFLMETGGISARLVRFASALVGHLQGGLGMTVILSTVFFSGVSGSSTADTAAVGAVTIPAMLKKGYPPGLTAAIVASAGAMGMLIPPCVLMVLYAVIANVSVAALFTAGFLPGLVMIVAMMGITFFVVGRAGLPVEPRPSLRELGAAAKGAILPLLMPVIILGGILGGIFTATEAAVVAVFYGLLLSVVVYREIPLRDLPGILVKATEVIGGVMLVVGMSSMFAWALASQQAPQQAASFMMSISEDPRVFLLLVNLLLIVAGMFLDASAALIIIAPILAPIAARLGLDPVHFGIVVVANLGIGLATPPVGLALFVAAGIARVNVEKVIRPLLPFIGALIVALAIITYVPEITLFLPRLLGL